MSKIRIMRIGELKNKPAKQPKVGLISLESYRIPAHQMN